MNVWDLVTWLSSLVLGASAVVIFGFFLRDASSILNRDMHTSDDPEEEDSASGGSAAGGTPTAPEDLPR